MINAEYREQKDERLKDLVRIVTKKQVTIQNLLGDAYDRGFSDGKKFVKCEEEKSLTFSELELGDKFRLPNDTVLYIKVQNVGYGSLAYNAVNFRCYEFQDDYFVIPIKEGDN